VSAIASLSSPYPTLFCPSPPAPRRVQVSREEPLLLPSNVGGGALPLRIAPLEAAAADPQQLMRLLQRHRRGLGRRGPVRAVSHLWGARACHEGYPAIR